LNRTPLCYLSEALPLLRVERTTKRNRLGDVVEESFPRLTIGAVLGVNALMFQVYRNGLQRPSFAVGVHPHGHRRAPTQRREQQLIRVRPEIRAARGNWFVYDQAVFTNLNVLCKTALTTNDDFNHGYNPGLL
jgi:hypothetical protein